MKIYKKLPIIRQAGSLICQDFSEGVKGHGYTIWDVSSNTPEHYDIENDNAHITLHVSSGKIKEKLIDLPKKPKVRLYYENTSPTELKEAVVEIRKNCDPIEVIPFKLKSETDKLTQDTSSNGNVVGAIKDLSDVEYQNTLIRDFFKNDPEVSKELLEEILKINKSTNLKLENYISSKEIYWIPKKLTFSNMFSYGEDNEIKFDNLEGIVGIFAKNRSGKSSIMNVVSFCLFDKCPPTNEAGKVLNSRKTEMTARFEFSVGDNTYYIERTATKDKKGNVPVKVKFKQVLQDGTTKDLEGESRAQTNDIIRKYVGTYDDFILTALSIQGSKSKNLIDLGQAERKELLSKFTGLDIYEKLSKLVSEDAKETLTKVKLYKGFNYEEDLSKLKSELSIRETKESEYRSQIEEIDSEIQKINDNIESESKNMKSINIEVCDLNTLETRLKNLTVEKESDSKKISELKEKLGVLESKKTDLESKIRGLDIEQIKKCKESNDKAKEKLSLIEKQISTFRVTVKNKIDKVKHLDNHKYDPNCKFCIENEFVKDALNAKSELENDKVKVKELLTQENEIKITISEDADSKHNEYLGLKHDYTDIISSINALNSQISRISPEKNDVLIEKVTQSIKNIKDNSLIIENNKKVDQNIAKLKISRQNYQDNKKRVEKEKSENHSRVSVINSKISEINSQIDEVKKIEFKAKAYSGYVKSVSKDGIPLNLLTNLLPLIEEETNEILSKITTFKTKIAVEDGDINIEMVEDGSVWPIEMGSGMEKFVTSVATRIGLINVSRIPKPSFITIDEGFGTLDDESISSLPALFAYLREEFNFVLLISHLDSIKDCVDDIIDITKNEGFSHVEYK